MLQAVPFVVLIYVGFEAVIFWGVFGNHKTYLLPPGEIEKATVKNLVIVALGGLV
jgi:hypothetical protein